MKLSAFTAEFLFIAIVAICLIDAVLEKTLGNDATISWTLLGIESTHPMFGLGILYSLTVLGFHLTNPDVNAAPSGLREYVNVVIALLPVLMTLIFIAVNPQGKQAAVDNLRVWFGGAGGWYWFGVAMVAVLLGALAGKELIPQHLS